ncbi:hypothetical protein SDJN02_06611, partial [Cucurbita argyrosperma subsp. argyrosperma]|uniref:Uncharacterized protein LOC111430025 isoform X1 n=1 Tax=Cucurbita moschata TaxID=3662 RepID=A0A6J1E1V2_CUCMO
MENSTAVADAGLDSQAPVHIQVVKIKREIEKIKHPSLQQSEMSTHLLLRDMSISKPRPRSPLGLAAERSISVGN